MISLTLNLIDQLQWVIAGILLGDSFDSYELTELWEALCHGDVKSVESIQKDIADQWKQAEMDDRHDNHYGDYCY